MGLIWTLLVGLIAGAIAKLLMPGKDPGGIFVTMALGVAGAFVGGFVAGALGMGDGGPAGIIGAIIGAMILLGAYRVMKKN